VIDENGAQLGIMSSKEANLLADTKNLDLVKINPGATPPVCKLMDYGKFKFDLSKRDKVARKNQKVVELKEVRLSMTIDVGDVNTKAKQTIKFLASGDKVKVSIRMRGRQQAHADIGLRNINEFYALVEEHATQEKKPSREGAFITMILAPKKV
jgi:translation initiation factor IF-3